MALAENQITLQIVEDGQAGAQGPAGPQGPAGADGQDGYSPTARVTKSGDTATITITDKTGTTTQTVSDGADGQDGTDGQDGKSAYEAAIEGGLPSTVTEAQFNTDLGDVPETKSIAEDAQEIAEEVQGEVSTLSTRVSAAETALDDVESSISGISTRVSAAESDIEDVESAIGSPSDSASSSGSLYARVKNVKDTSDQAVADIQAEVTRAQAAEQQVETLANAASASAASAGRSASLAQAALDTMGDYEWAMVAVTSPSGNPKAKRWWERTGTAPNYDYHYTTDTSVVAGKAYYQLDPSGQYFYKDINGAHIVDGSDNGFRTDIQSNGMEITDTSTNNVVAAFTSSGYNIGNVDAPHQVGAPMSWKMIDWDGNTYAEVRDVRSSKDDDLLIENLDVNVYVDYGYPVTFTASVNGKLYYALIPTPTQFDGTGDWFESTLSVSDNISGEFSYWPGSVYGRDPISFPAIDGTYRYSNQQYIRVLLGVYESAPYDYVVETTFTITYIAPNEFAHAYKFGVPRLPGEGGICSLSSGTSLAEGVGAVALGLDNTAIGAASTVEGMGNTANAYYSHVEGYKNVTGIDGQSGVFGIASHAEGSLTVASGECSHAEGRSNEASGDFSHAEGHRTIASGGSSHAEGGETEASGYYSHAEGGETEASGSFSHAEGDWTTASGSCSHAEGQFSIASGPDSHAEGSNTEASGSYQHVQGKYNVADNTSTYADIVGNGSSSGRSNAYALDWSGNGYFAGDVYVGCNNDSTGGTKLSGGITQAQLLNFIYPVGSIYMSVNNVSPQTFLGGTWAAFGAGRVLVGVGTGTDEEGLEQTYAAGATGGVYERIMSEDNLPEHRHSISHTHPAMSYTNSKLTTGTSAPRWYSQSSSSGTTVVNTGAASTSNSGYTGGGMPMNIEQPYIAVYMWKRTA